MSFTVTVNIQLDVLPLASIAVAVTVVVPTGKVDPDGGLATTDTPGQLSEAITVKFTTAEHCPVVLPTVMFDGQVIDGGWLSLIVTVNEQLAVLPDASATEQLTVVVPTGNAEPAGGLQTGVPTPGQLSIAVGDA